MKNQEKFTSRSNKLKKTRNKFANDISVSRQIFSDGNIHRYSPFFFSFFWFLSRCCFFVCLFVFKLKIYILLHIRQCRRVNDKKFFTQPISGHKITFFWPKYAWIIGPKSINIHWLDFHFQPNFNVETTLIHHFEST